MNYLFEPQAVVGLPIAGHAECFPGTPCRVAFKDFHPFQ